MTSSTRRWRRKHTTARYQGSTELQMRKTRFYDVFIRRGQASVFMYNNTFIKANVIVFIFTRGKRGKKKKMRAGVMNRNKMSHLQVNGVNGPTVIPMIRASILIIINI